jgi:Raf kinase inhibitor-like YbhB/YbcL family protein
MVISSSAFEDGKPIPTKFAYHGVIGGKNISIPLSWNGSPAGTASFALSIVDPHPIAGNWVHWFAINIPSSVRSLAEGASGMNMPSGCKELYNTYGTLGYGGPEPPKGSGPHPYEITLYALSSPSLNLSLNSTLQAFTRALEGNVLAKAQMTGIFER